MKNTPLLLIRSAIAFAVMILLFSCGSRKLSSRSAHVNTADKHQFYFLFLSDVHLSRHLTRSAYWQDAGLDLWDSCRRKIDAVLNSPAPPAFILYTGDMPEHMVDARQRGQDIDLILTDLQKMSAIHHTPLFYLPGNNDALDSDYCFFLQKNNTNAFSLTGDYPYPYKAFNVAKTGGNGAYMISDAAIAKGYYAASIMKGLRIISLNSVLWSSQVCPDCFSSCDSQYAEGQRQMAWLEKQLSDAAAANDKVYLAMHIPPGLDAYATSQYGPTGMWESGSGWQDTFLHTVAMYQKTISGIFFGHTHMDEFRLLHDNSPGESFMQVALSCPGISPKFNNNPGFKLVMADSSSKLPMDFTTYYATVDTIKWQPPYRFSQLQGVDATLSIYDALRKMTPQERINALNAIYTVQHGPVKKSYDTLGMNVRWMK